MRAMQFPTSEGRRQKYGEHINMNISEEGKALIKKFESCRLEAYKCSANVWTCGWGATKGVDENTVWSQSYADERFEGDIQEFENYVNDLVTAPLQQCQFDALCSWCYNLGPANLKSSSMLRVLNEGNYEEVPYQLQRWNKANGEILEGLVRRRKAEALLFEDKDWTNI